MWGKDTGHTWPAAERSQYCRFVEATNPRGTLTSNVQRTIGRTMKRESVPPAVPAKTYLLKRLQDPLTAAARVAALPDVPAAAEALPGFEVIGWVLHHRSGQPAPAHRRQAASGTDPNIEPAQGANTSSPTVRNRRVARPRCSASSRSPTCMNDSSIPLGQSGHAFAGRAKCEPGSGLQFHWQPHEFERLFRTPLISNRSGVSAQHGEL